MTISHEGRQRNEQDKRQPAGSAMDSYMERVMMREQEQAQEFKGEQSNTLNEITELMKELQIPMLPVKTRRQSRNGRMHSTRCLT